MYPICSKMVTFLLLSILAAIFVTITIATVKVKLMTDFYTWAVVLINYDKRKLVKTSFIFFVSFGGQYYTIID